MKNQETNKPLFLGLTHIGQVYSIAWTKKIGSCAVFDFNISNLRKFKKNKFTEEERDLSKININKKKIFFCKRLQDIKKFKYIFFTYDTPINNKGYPNIDLVENKLKKLLRIKFDAMTYIIITSQVYPGFTDYIKKKYLKNNNLVRLVYMVDTLKMGNALNRFTNPEQLIFGCEKSDKNFILELFKKFNCKKFIKSYKEAELIKISINLYLYFSVSFSNIIDNFSKHVGVNYLKIIENLKKDKRIGHRSYIYPSPSISGGHLERDVFYLKKKNKDLNIKRIFSNLENFNNSRKKELQRVITSLINKKIIKLLIIGISYKDSSFSMVNSIFQKIFESKKIKTSYYDSYFKKKNKNKIKINQKVNLKKAINQSDITIMNYCNVNDLLIIKNEFSKSNLKKYLINISIKNQNLFGNNKNVIKFYSKNNDYK